MRRPVVGNEVIIGAQLAEVAVEPIGPFAGHEADPGVADVRGFAARVPVHDNDPVRVQAPRFDGSDQPVRRGRADPGSADDDEGGYAKGRGYRDSSFFLTRPAKVSKYRRPAAVSVAAHSALRKAEGCHSTRSRST